MSADLAQSHPLLSSAARTEIKAAPRTVVPWYIWAGALAVTSASIGGHWDVAWHRSIGRDTIWPPALFVFFACGVFVGVVGLYLVLTATFVKSKYASRLREASVSIFGLRAPLGVFLAG